MLATAFAAEGTRTRPAHRACYPTQAELLCHSSSRRLCVHELLSPRLRWRAASLLAGLPGSNMLTLHSNRRRSWPACRGASWSPAAVAPQGQLARTGKEMLEVGNLIGSKNRMEGRAQDRPSPPEPACATAVQWGMRADEQQGCSSSTPLCAARVRGSGRVTQQCPAAHCTPLARV